MQKLIGAIILDKILERVLDRDTLMKTADYIKSNDKSQILSRIFRYVKYFAILFFLSAIILITAVIYLLYYIFTHFT